MKLTPQEFTQWPEKRITLLGMSGVGKTHLSTLLRRHNWFHYSGDYRIGTRYLDEPIIDMIKRQAMQVPFLCDLLRRDWISIRNNIKVHDLGPVLSYVGKPGNPQLGGLELETFIEHQARYRQAEVDAMLDVPDFIRKGQEIYGYQHFVNDVGGSLCELDDDRVLKTLIDHTLILYIEVTNEAEAQKLIERAQSDPKPLYYNPDFLQQQLASYLEQQQLQFAAEMDPDEFTRWIFPRLFHSRIPKYEAIAAPHGYTVTSEQVGQVRDEADFIELLESAIAEVC
ncbi:ATPase [Ectothiorhodospiraceae bacterium BW-2]|nr:ATPase [Ectothiorhodospiraceae bacterium BW-2]